MPSFGALTGAEPVYSQTVATVIPVFLVAYLVGVGRLVRVLSESAFAGILEPLRGSFRTRVRRSARRNVFYVVLYLVVFAAIGLAAVAEYDSIHALYDDRASAGIRQISLWGTLVAAGVALVPILVAYCQGMFISNLPGGPVDEDETVPL